MKKSLIILLLVLFIPSLLMAQEEQKPKKHEGAEWYRIIYLEFETGKRAEAEKIIVTYWEPVNKKVNLEQNVFKFYSGTWDLVRIVKMKDGISQLDWEVSPLGIEFNKELLKLAGSEESMNKIREQWYECVKNTKVEIVRKR
jgi:hypothetical protein